MDVLHTHFGSFNREQLIACLQGLGCFIISQSPDQTVIAKLVSIINSYIYEGKTKEEAINLFMNEYNLIGEINACTA